MDDGEEGVRNRQEGPSSCDEDGKHGDDGRGCQRTNPFLTDGDAADDGEGVFVGKSPRPNEVFQEDLGQGDDRLVDVVVIVGAVVEYDV